MCTNAEWWQNWCSNTQLFPFFYPRTSKLYSPLFSKKGTTHKTSVLQEKQKKNFSETFLFIANELFEAP
jgi:hypothetical protein